MSFFMRSLLRTVPLLGALILSAAPVQAIETFEELDEACLEILESMMLCQGLALIGAGSLRLEMLCELVKQDLITTENAVKMWKNYRGPPLWNEAARRTLKEYPKCPLKPKSAAYSYN